MELKVLTYINNMALSQEQQIEIAKQLAQKRQVMGDSGFSSYLNKIDSAIPQKRQETVQEKTKLDTDVSPKGILGTLARITGVEKMGVALGASLASKDGSTDKLEQATSTGQDIALLLQKQILKNKNEGKSTSRLEMALEELNAQNQSSTDAVMKLGTGGVSNRDVVGSAIRTAGTIASAGTFGAGSQTGRLATVTAPKLTTATTAGQGALQGAFQGLKTGAASGAVFGGVSGLATGVEQNKGVLGTAFEIAKQGAVGGALGGAVGSVAGGVGGAFQARANRKEELASILSKSDTVDDALKATTVMPKADNVADTATTQAIPSRTTAGFKLENKKVVPDKPAQKLLRQGVDETDVAIMQSMSPADREAAKKMVQIAKEVSDTGLPTKRQQEVVGQAFMTRVKDVETLNRTAGGQIDDIARTQLAGKQVNAGKATDQFFNQLERDGVDIDALRLANTKEEIAQAFEGSSYEGLDTVQRTLKTVLKRVDPDLAGANMDGLQLHRAKRFIDNQVTYGKNAEGLVGDAERLLKGLRSSIDDVLDTTFPDYNVANTQYKETIEALDEMRRLIGRDFIGSGDIANLRAGEVMNRLLGQASAKPMSALQNLENVSRKYGNSYSDSIVKQVRFADLLDDIYETVPKGSLQGRVSGGVASGIDQGVGFMNRMRQGGLISATIDTAGDIAKGAAGVTPEARQKAVEEFLGLTTK